jgi:hypothetical protein
MPSHSTSRLVVYRCSHPPAPFTSVAYPTVFSMDILRRISSRKRTTKPAPDPNIIKALCLDPTTISITSHGHSQFTTTLKLTAKVNGEDKLFFVKTGGKDSQTMFAGVFAIFSSCSDSSWMGDDILFFCSNLLKTHRVSGFSLHH